MASHNEIISIFGEIEKIVANQMIAEGKGVVLLAPTPAVSLDDLSESVRFNPRGEKVRMVIVLSRQLMVEFDRRVENLRQ